MLPAIGCMVAAGTVLLLACGTGEMDLERDGWTACGDFVRDSLVSPSSARFERYGSREGISAMVADSGLPLVLAAGEVSAENRYGARVRYAYVCRVVFEWEHERWAPRLVFIAEKGAY